MSDAAPSLVLMLLRVVDGRREDVNPVVVLLTRLFELIDDKIVVTVGYVAVA
jgi:hypothetical protein